MTLGNKLSKLRKENNYTQEQLASILGVSRQAISKWESDITYPETDKLIRISELFDCSLDYLLKSEVKSDNNNTQEIQENSNNMAVLVDSEKEKFSKLFMGILYLVIAILIFYFGGNIIESIFNIGKEFGKSIGNVFWG